MGRMVAALMLGLAKIEWEYWRDRQAAGIAVARRNGVYRGRAQGTTKARPDRAKELQGQGMSAPEIGRALGVSIRIVFRYLAAGD
jgi:DNA invertase Pin-like site-specific DNA recombinase